MLRHHHHINARVDGLGTIVGSAVTHLTHPVPVADYKPVKTEALLEYLRQECVIAMYFIAIPAVERGHYREHPNIDRFWIACPVLGHQCLESKSSVPLVITTEGATIPNKMLRCRRHAYRLHGFHKGTGVFGHQPLIATERFIGSAPAIISSDRNSRAENPVNAGGTNFTCSGRRDVSYQGRICSRAQTDVVGKKRRSYHVVMAVNCIGAPDDRNTGAAT